MAGLGWLAPRILAHLDHTQDFYLDQVAQVVMDRWSSGRVGLLGDAAFSSSPLSRQGTGLALVSFLTCWPQSLAAAGWDPGAGVRRLRGGEMGARSSRPTRRSAKLHARSRDMPAGGRTPAGL